MPTGLRLDLIEPLVRQSLAEDLGAAGDITTNAIIPSDARAGAVMRARKPGVLAGIDGAALVFTMLDSGAQVKLLASDGAALVAGQEVLGVEGTARGILGAERTALNFVCHLSGIATETAKIVALVEGTGARIACTRKTNPGLRYVEKHAVRMGGGANHRMGLYDAMLVKDNHIAVAGSIRRAAEEALRARAAGVRVEVEVDTPEQLDQIADLPIDAVLLDNMSIDQLRACVARVKGRIVTEASGGVTAANVRAIAETGVDIISLGWLTHSAPALDVGLDIDVGGPDRA
jgi:nicotinate-nucleotide pyrophosphorylase (carboxylating)